MDEAQLIAREALRLYRQGQEVAAARLWEAAKDALQDWMEDNDATR